MGNISSTKIIKIKGHTSRKNGKKHTVKSHTRKIPAELVTKKQYAEKFKTRPTTSQTGDAKRRSKYTLKGTSNKLRPGWNTKNYDWVGVDARSYPKITRSQMIRTLTGSIPTGYKIIKFSMPSRRNGQFLTRYLPYYKGSPIGPTTPHAKLTDAQNICNTHHGRATGKIKNRNQEEDFMRQTHTVKKAFIGSAWKHQVDPEYFDEQEDDHGISYSERLQERKFRKTMRGYDIHNRGY